MTQLRTAAIKIKQRYRMARAKMLCAADREGGCPMKRILGATYLLFVFVSADAALIDRGGGFIYDDVLDVTWLQDANVQINEPFNGANTWAHQVAWADGLSVYDSVRDVTWDDWRLPTTLQPDASCTSQLDPGGGLPLQGSGYNCSGGEMGHLFYADAGQLILFTNLQSDYYWSGTEYEVNGSYAWQFHLRNGLQDTHEKDGADFNYALAVRDGDVAAVPVPAAAWLLSSALGLLCWIRVKPD